MSETAKASGACSRPTVFYDGSCPMCRGEIGLYRGLSGAEAIDWVDVSANADPAVPVAGGLTRAQAMSRFHMVGSDGRLRSGAAAFARLWTELPGLRVAGRIASLPGIRHLLELAYRAFLPVRPRLQRLFRSRSDQL